MAPGFGSAPVSKCLCLISFVASITVLVINKPDIALLDVNKIFNKLELWRLITSQFVFTTPSGIFFGLMLLYTFREFERRFKTAKFSVAVLVMMILSIIFEVALLALNITKRIAPGPFSIIFGLFTFFFSEIPPSAKGGIFFIPVSDKTFKYLFGLQLMFSEYPSACWPSLCGLLAGILYRSQLLPFSKIRIPRRMREFCARNCNCFSNTRRRRNAGYQQVPEMDPAQPQQLFGPPIVQQVNPDPAAVQTLVGMGFDEGPARMALARTGNNVEAAVGVLGGGAW
eukprot:CAMPEP_0114512972 /NCGR_PEP_ID=MMETSP0109-20121206/15286_1 /TAXON_ID=29199 /ORGANISM="Chlorarachnion reptans, Strain CCCM449" /LENGTH=283 /DNA_ID=CAMNT_0001692743 /DNA_START=181 /DNA_END=1032 /DNA_ORIENTATION=-